MKEQEVRSGPKGEARVLTQRQVILRFEVPELQGLGSSPIEIRKRLNLERVELQILPVERCLNRGLHLLSRC
jgi:hypothetical protein